MARKAQLALLFVIFAQVTLSADQKNKAPENTDLSSENLRQDDNDPTCYDFDGEDGLDFLDHVAEDVQGVRHGKQSICLNLETVKLAFAAFWHLYVIRPYHYCNELVKQTISSSRD